jgi:hypothetical protein
MDFSNAEKTLTNLMNSRMINEEIQFKQLMDNFNNDLNSDILNRKYEVT